ncbi:MAG: hypothetical protein KJ054_12905 [Gammaproteobacteria bacterium]|nr:hypothetical protein [Gammaproteobacteria bacterium]
MIRPFLPLRADRSVATLQRAALLATVACTGLAAVPAAVEAASLVEYNLIASSQDGVSSPDAGVFQLPLPAEFSEEAASGNARASAEYAFGSSGVRATASWAAGGTNQTAASARVLVLDSFTLLAPLGSTGFGAHLSFSVGYSGSLVAFNGAALWAGSAELSSAAYRDGSFSIVRPVVGFDVEGRQDSTTGSTGTGLPAMLTGGPTGAPGTTDFFLFGVPIDLRWIVQTAIDLKSGAGSADADLSQTAVWLGITARDAQGALIEGIRITTSASGQNWLLPAEPVPLPATASLLLTGFAAIGLRATRRAARRR